MIIEHDEKAAFDVEGTIIDIETIGDFDRSYKSDSRQYREMIQVILGYVNHERLHIYCAKGMEGVDQLRSITQEVIGNLDRPFYAFNCEFESGVWFHHMGIEVRFDGELQRYRYESKTDAVGPLGIPNYDDPFLDGGYECIEAWRKEEFDKAIAHNRACLLKERDILLKRGYREPVPLAFIA